ncbi:MAG: DNA polymerase Y family protein [Myxococcales bacterium]|nr:DNA polymerase Y family protein [Myxococcales bacterium]
MRLCYLHLPRFPVQRRVVETPSLSKKPLALVEDARGVRRVAFASAAALKLGVRPGMTLASARALTPELAAFDFSPQAERAALLSMGEALLAIAPAFELSAPDGLWLDASAAALCGGEEGLCRRALEICSAFGYRARAALASQRFTARAMARYGERPIEVVEVYESAMALSSLPLAALEEDDSSPLASLGLTTLGEAAALPLGAVVARLGAQGLRALRLSRGEDDTPFTAEALPERIEERISLDWPAEALEPLLFALKTVLDRLGARLAGRKRAAVRLVLTLRLDPAGEAELPLSLARPSAQPKLLLDLARHQLSDLTLDKPIGALWVRVEEHCEDPGQQLTLGDGPTGDAALEVVLSRLCTALGQESLFSARLLDRHRPEGGFAPGAFRPPERPSGLAAEALGPLAPPPDGEASLARPPRLFPRAAELQAELGEQGQILSARLLGKRRRVLAMAGPERLCGEWWTDSPFVRDYYQVHLEGIGPVWLYRDGDGRFYLQGMFD